MSKDTTLQQPELADIEITIAGLQAEIKRLEQALQSSNETAKKRLMEAQLRAAAVQAGMIDLDGLKLLDFERAKPNEFGELERADELMMELKREKPWLFGGKSSSSRASVPPAQPPRAKLATEMSSEEYRSARAELLRRR